MLPLSSAHCSPFTDLQYSSKHKLSICCYYYDFPPSHYVLLYTYNNENCRLISILFSFQAQRTIQRRIQAGKFRTLLLLLLLFVRASLCCLGSALFLVYIANLVSRGGTNTDPLQSSRAHVGPVQCLVASYEPRNQPVNGVNNA